MLRINQKEGAMKKRINWLLTGVSLIVCLYWIGPVAAQVTLEVLNPRGELPPAPTMMAPNPRVANLAGKKIALVANYKAGAELFLTKIEELMKAKYPTATILRFKMQSTQGDPKKLAGVFDEVAKSCDVFVHSTGD
jgi:hypothetical protein